MPKAVTIGSNPPGTGYYAVASGLAKVVSQGAGMQMSVQPHSGTISSVDVGLAYRGPGYKIGDRNPFQFSPNVRVVQRGSPLLVGLLVRKDSPRFVDPDPTLPYHTGAIRFYKDKGAWSPAMDQAQQKVLTP